MCTIVVSTKANQNGKCCRYKHGPPCNRQVREQAANEWISTGLCHAAGLPSFAIAFFLEPLLLPVRRKKSIIFDSIEIVLKETYSLAIMFSTSFSTNFGGYFRYSSSAFLRRYSKGRSSGSCWRWRCISWNIFISTYDFLIQINNE